MRAICRFAELDYLLEAIYCNSEFHAPLRGIIRQLPKITNTYKDKQNLKMQKNSSWQGMQRCDWSVKLSEYKLKRPKIMDTYKKINKI